MSLCGIPLCGKRLSRVYLTVHGVGLTPQEVEVNLHRQHCCRHILRIYPPASFLAPQFALTDLFQRPEKKQKPQQQARRTYLPSVWSLNRSVIYNVYGKEKHGTTLDTPHSFRPRPLAHTLPCPFAATQRDHQLETDQQRDSSVSFGLTPE